MSDHIAEIVWRRETERFGYEVYNRGHVWRFDSGQQVAASAAPAFRGDADRIDPEEAFVAAVSSCHMLTFLAVAARHGFVVDAYRDRAVGRMEKTAEGRLAITRIVLSPQIAFAAGAEPDPETLRGMHKKSHEDCFIANSVKTEIEIEA